MNAQLGKILIAAGLALVVIGALVLLGDKWSWLRLGRLPGDLTWQNSSGSVRVYVPLATSLLLSLLLTLLFWLFRK
jgi:H+/Cl- antiporter ClcA